MTDELRRQFRDRLFVVARERHRRAAAGLASGDPEIVRAELHSLAGEAHMLGELTLAGFASAGEQAAKGWAAGSEVERREAASALTGIASVLEKFG